MKDLTPIVHGAPGATGGDRASARQTRPGVNPATADGTDQLAAQEQAEIYYGDVGCANSTAAGGIKNSG